MEARPSLNATPQTSQTSSPTHQAPGQLQDPEAVTGQIVRAARLISRGASNEVTVRLDPPELGAVTVRLVSEGRILSGHIVVENQQVHELVQARLAELHESLGAQGLQVDHIQVSVDGRSTSGAQRDANQFNLREDSGNGRPDSDESSQRNPDGQHASRQYRAQPEGLFDTVA